MTLAASALVAAALAGRSDDSSRSAVAPRSSPAPQERRAKADALLSEARRLPAPRPSPLRLGRIKPLHLTRALPRWSPVVRATSVRRSSGPDARAIAFLSPKTPEGTTNIVLVIEEEAAGGLWVHVRLPILPNSRTGWVPRSALGGYHFVRTRLVVDRERFTATLLRDGLEVFRVPVGVGKPEWPTPKGEFYVRDKLTDFDNPFYGPLAFGTSARSAVLTDWPDGGFVGIHGTNEPELLPGRVSHGCIRMRNEDIVRLSRMMPVGTPLTIV